MYITEAAQKNILSQQITRTLSFVNSPNNQQLKIDLEVVRILKCRIMFSKNNIKMSINKNTFKNEIRSCTLISNGQSPIRLMLNSNTKFMDIMKLIQIVWRQSTQMLRLFLQDGTEIEEKDLIQVKKGTILHVQLTQEKIDLKLPYDFIKKIGDGGQGVVYLGKHKVTQEFVAIKKVNQNTWKNQELSILQQESLILKLLDHKNIVKLHEATIIPQQKEVIMIMEYLSGGSLLTQANSKLSEIEAKQYSRQLVDAIAYCHEKNVVHCDLKLENIMMTSQIIKQVKIIDFGVSNFCGHPLNADSIVGTLSYLAPEVLSPNYKHISTSQDVWALGCIIYGLVFGKLPFDGLNQSETYRNILQCNYSIPKKSVSKELISLLNLIFVLNPNERANIFEIKNHSWFRENAKIYKLNLSAANMKIGRSSSVSKFCSFRKSKDEDQMLLISSRKIVCSRRSVSRLDKLEFVRKIK